MQETDYIRSKFLLLEQEPGVIVSSNFYAQYNNTEVRYDFRNGSSVTIWTDRSDVYVTLRRADRESIDLAQLCSRPALRLSDYAALTRSEWPGTVATWLGLRVPVNGSRLGWRLAFRRLLGRHTIPMWLLGTGLYVVLVAVFVFGLLRP